MIRTMEDTTKELIRDLMGVVATDPDPSREELITAFSRVRDELVQQKRWLNQSIDLFNNFAALYDMPATVWPVIK